jgi:UDP-glucose 4-epimerase
VHCVDGEIDWAIRKGVPLVVGVGYYRNNTVSSRALIETAFRNNVRQFIFSSTCAVYGNPAQVPVTEEAPRRSRPMTRRS